MEGYYSYKWSVDQNELVQSTAQSQAFVIKVMNLPNV